MAVFSSIAPIVSIQRAYIFPLMCCYNYRMAYQVKIIWRPLDRALNTVSACQLIYAIVKSV